MGIFRSTNSVLSLVRLTPVQALRTRPGYVPKFPTTPFRDQVVNLQALPLEEADPTLALICPVHALQQYVDRTQRFGASKQLFVCYGGQQEGKAVFKQRMAHCITLPFEAQDVPCPLRLRAHSTRGVASSWMLARGALHLPFIYVNRLDLKSFFFWRGGLQAHRQECVRPKSLSQQCADRSLYDMCSCGSVVRALR